MAKKRKPLSTAKPAETCVLIGLATRHQRREQLEEYLEELAFLAETAKAERQRTFIQSLDKPDVRTFVGSGKLQEIKEYVEEEDIDMIIFDDELSPIQLRNIEKESPERKVRPDQLDFGHLRPTCSHGSRQDASGTGAIPISAASIDQHVDPPPKQRGIGMKGPGEKEIETDRRFAIASPCCESSWQASTNKWPPNAKTEVK